MAPPTNIRFFATEAGFEDGLGGASNSKGKGQHHYVVFGAQDDKQHPTNSGVYFEYDDENNGDVNRVQKVIVFDDEVTFVLDDVTEITVEKSTSERNWMSFVRGIELVFGKDSMLDRRVS